MKPIADNEAQPAAVEPLADLKARVTPQRVKASGVVELLQRESGLLSEGSSLIMLTRAITRRMLQLGEDSLERYVRALRLRERGGQELDDLVALVVVLKTYLFRDRAQFDLLREDVLPRLLAERDRIRIWSAGCATGEEPYSIAVVLRQLHLLPGQASILATDVSRPALETAAAARYRGDKLSRLSPEERSYFERLDDDWYKCRKQLREMVDFRYHNLVSAAYPEPGDGPFDIIFCRNVMIYFDRETTALILSRFREVLRPTGFLFLGNSESLFRMESGFELVPPSGSFIYRRDDSPARRGLSATTAVRPALKVVPPVIPASPAIGSAEAPQAGPPPSADATRSTDAAPTLVALEPDPNTASTGTADPEDPLADIRQHMEQGDRHGLRERLLQIVEDEPGRSDAYFLLGRLCADDNAMEEARSWLQAGLDLDSLNTSARFLLALVMYRLDANEEAASELRRLLFLDGTSALGYYYLGLVAERIDDLPTARRSFRNAMRCLSDAEQLESDPLLEGEPIQKDVLIASCRSRLLKLGSPGE